MAKSKSDRTASVPPDIPRELGDFLQQASEGSYPTPSDEELAAFPTLLGLLTPRRVSKAPEDPEAKRVKGMYLPMLMLVWDMRAGAWTWTISDKFLNFAVSGQLHGLSEELKGIESALLHHNCRARERKIGGK